MKIDGQNFNFVDTLDSPITVPDCFVMRPSKIGGGNGEAKLYIASKSVMYPFFGNKGFVAKCFLLKSDLLSYMNALHAEYLHPSQAYRGADEMPELWKERVTKIEKLPEIIEFNVTAQDKIGGPRGYVNSKDAGYQLIRGCGCRNGFCGACATIYRIKGERELKTCLACQTKVENNMYVATLPFFPLVKQVYDIEKIKPTEQIMMQLYPEIYACVGCNACTKSCTQGLNVMQYIAYAQRGEFDKCAEASFDCVMCGVCSSRCPAGISHPQVAMLARRLNGKYLAPKSEHLENRVKEIQNGDFNDLISALMGKPIEELKELYNNRDIEK